ncbi:MAG TPA: Rieske (2Fe-2S) protein [Streptosporangiaceae bacterium]
MTQESQPVCPRRAVLVRGGLAGIGLAGLAAAVTACGGSSGSGDSMSGGSGSGSSGSGMANSGSSPSAGGDLGSALGATSEVPVGGGKVFNSAKVVVTQPSAGEYKAFSAVCTHAQCIVDEVANGTIDCPCHGSKFSAKDGSVITGPASSPLPSQKISVSSGKITLA